MRNDHQAALENALKKLASSDKTVSEVRLLLADFAIEEIDQCIEVLVECNLVDDDRLAKNLAERSDGRRAIGIRSLAEKLHNRGIDPVIVENIITSRVSTETSRARKLLQAKFPDGATSAKAARYLWSRGVEESTIDSLLENHDSE